MNSLLLSLVVLAVAFIPVQADEPKGDEKKGDKSAVGALPPHPLDAAFEKARSERAIWDALLNNDLYRKAVREALKAKIDQEARFKQDPKFVGATPAQAARQKFLEVLTSEPKGEKKSDQ